MAATPKHRRSSSKKMSTRASQRYDVLLAKARKIKKFGGKLVQVSKENGKFFKSHRISENNPTHKGINIISKSKKK